MITVENSVGRLVTIRQTGSVTMAELQASAPRFQAILDAAKGKVVLGTDWRGMRTLAPEVANVLLAIMRAEDARVERQVVVTDPSAVIGMQIGRLFREGAGTQSRAVYQDPLAAQKWLGEVLSVPERVQFRKFLEELGVSA
jgi:hypothetical protein